MASPLRSIRHWTARRVRAAGAAALTTAHAVRHYVIAVVVLLALLAFMASAPIRSLDAANQRVEYLQATKDQLRSSVAELEQRRDRLQDPDEIELLARNRFGLVKPGENAYVVVRPEEELRAEAEPPDGAGHRPWYRWLVDAVVDMLPG